MKFVFNDGGRKAAGYEGKAGDCVTRAISIIAELPYQEVYDAINERAQSERRGKRKRGISSARGGVYKPTYKKYLSDLGFIWTPTMFIGSGCKVHLHDGELPMGRLIVCVSKHLTAVIDGVVHDTHDPQRDAHVSTRTYDADGNPHDVHTVQRRCVYGYFQKGAV